MRRALRRRARALAIRDHARNHLLAIRGVVAASLRRVAFLAERLESAGLPRVAGKLGEWLALTACAAELQRVLHLAGRKRGEKENCGGVYRRFPQKNRLTTGKPHVGNGKGEASHDQNQ